MVSVEEPMEGGELENEPSLTTDTTITSPFLNSDEEVTPPLLQPTNIIPSTENIQVVPSPIEEQAPNSRQRLLPSVPNVTVAELGHGLAHSILSLANADSFKNAVVYGKIAP